LNKRERVIEHIKGGQVDHLPNMPITMMFAADWSGVPYHVYATQASAMASAQMRVCEEFGFDHVSIISDPAVEAADLGAAVVFFEDQPPALDDTLALLKDKSVLGRLAQIEPSSGRRMSNRIEGVRLLREQVSKEILVEGWVEGPCAEGADLRGINDLMTDFYDDPEFVSDLFAFVIDNAMRFARAQIDAGADIIGVGDAAASLVGPKLYRKFVLSFEKQLVDTIHAAGCLVRLHICGKTLGMAADIATLGCDIVDIDFPNPLDAVRAAVGPDTMLLGNLDPVRLLRDSPAIRVTREIEMCHSQAGARYIVGAGCEIPRDTAAPNIKALSSYARNRKPGEFTR